MTPEEIAIIVQTAITLTQFAMDQIGKAEFLTPEQKQGFIDRITAAQAAIPEWK